MAVLRIVARQQRWRPPGRSAQSLPPHAPHDGAQQTPPSAESTPVQRAASVWQTAVAFAGRRRTWMSKQTPAVSRHTWPRHGGSRAHCFWQPRPRLCKAESVGREAGAAYSSRPARARREHGVRRVGRGDRGTARRVLVEAGEPRGPGREHLDVCNRPRRSAARTADAPTVGRRRGRRRLATASRSVGVGEVSRLLYGRGVAALHRQRFVVMTKARFTLEIQPDVASAVDYAVCATASLFVGNAYSAFSYLLREGALVRGAAERAGYYNLDASDGGGELGDITRREAVRWGVLPLGTRQLGAGVSLDLSVGQNREDHRPHEADEVGERHAQIHRHDCEIEELRQPTPSSWTRSSTRTRRAAWRRSTPRRRPSRLRRRLPGQKRRKIPQPRSVHSPAGRTPAARAFSSCPAPEPRRQFFVDRVKEGENRHNVDDVDAAEHEHATQRACGNSFDPLRDRVAGAGQHRRRAIFVLNMLLGRERVARPTELLSAARQLPRARYLGARQAAARARGRGRGRPRAFSATAVSRCCERARSGRSP